MSWEERHLNWTWFLVSLLAAPSIGGIGAFTLGLADPDLVEPAFSIITFSVIVVITVWYLKRKNRGLGNLFWLILPFGIIVLLCFKNLSSKPTPHVIKTQEEKHENRATESQDKEKEYEQNVWEIYRKEWATASNEKRIELNKRMLRWQELMKNGVSASHAYIRVMQEEYDTPLRLIPAKKKTITKTTRYLLVSLASVVLLATSLVIYAQISAPAPEPALAPTSVQRPEPPPAPVANPRYVYQDGATHVGGDNKPIELINNPNATNPTYAELIAFIVANSVDTNTYIKEGPKAYVCSDYAEDIHNDAEATGIRAAWVGIDLKGEDKGHSINAFETTDRGLVYVDCTGASLSERLRQILITPSSNTTTPKPTSRDSIAYVEIGKEYGCIDIAKAKSPSYSFYDEYKLKWHECDRLISEYNEEVIQCNQEIETLKVQLEEKRQMIDKAYQEYEMLVGEYNDQVAKYNRESEAWKVRLEEKERLIDKLAEEIGEFWIEPLGIVEDIHIYWGGAETVTPPSTTPAPPTPTPLEPAHFVLGELSIIPTAVTAGEVVTISIPVSNTGGIEGSYTVVFKVKGDGGIGKPPQWTAIDNVEVTLKAGQTKMVTHTTKGQGRMDESGLFKVIPDTYRVDVNGKVGQFIVTEPPPTPEELEAKQVIEDLAYIKIMALEYSDDADPEPEGISFRIMFYDSKSKPINFQNIPVPVTIKLYSDKNQELVYEEQLTIYRADLIGISPEIHIPFEKIPLDQNNYDKIRTIEVTVTTPKQGDFQATSSLLPPRAEKIEQIGEG